MKFRLPTIDYQQPTMYTQENKNTYSQKTEYEYLYTINLIVKITIILIVPKWKQPKCSLISGYTSVTFAP